MATITTMVEAERGCGFRTPGGIYIMSDGLGQSCNLLPVELHVCPTCGAGIKPTRGGWTWVKPDPLMPHHSDSDTTRRHGGCPLNDPGDLGERAGLMWVGGSFYPTPESWLKEGKKMGFSRRVSGVPRGFKLGETWILTAHRKVQVGVEVNGVQYASMREAAAVDRIGDEGDITFEPVFKPAVFHLWMPSRVDYVVKGTETEEELDAIEARGLTLVNVVRAGQEELQEVNDE